MCSVSPADDDRKGVGLFEQQRLTIQECTCGESGACACSHPEKPSQRKHYKIAESNAAYVKGLPSYCLGILLGILMLLGFLTNLINYSTPKVISEEEAGFAQVSEERAWGYLRGIVGSGPRVAGSRSHRRHTVALKAQLDQLAAGATQTVRTDWQLLTDDFYLAYRLPYITSYQQASNVIALLEGESGLNADGSSNSSLLFNCHYDSVPTSPGASDNAIFCAVMVETLLLLSMSQHKMKHNIIFLFNGAEENALQASHAFLSHPWSRGVTGLVNLDSAGMNGKANLFQVTDPRVLAAYSASVQRPSAQSIGEALFASGVVPSDTDFRIFRDFGPIYGVDIAFTHYGHVYHTRFDDMSLIQPGVLQHTGNMIYRLAMAMGDMDEFHERRVETSAAVYYDYLYLFMLNYSFTTANVVDSLVAAFASSSVFYYLWIVGRRWKLLKEFTLTVAAVLASLLTGCVVVLLLTLVMVATSSQLRYYSNPWMVVPMYWVPFLLTAVTVMHTFDRWRANKCGLNRSLRTSQAMAANRFMWTLVLVFLLAVPGTATMRYAVSVPLMLTTLFAYVSLTVRRLWRVNAWQQLLMELVLSLPAQMFIFMLCLNMDSLMLPIMGRSLTWKPDYTVAVINVVLVVLSCLPLAGIELLFSRRRLWLTEVALGVVALILMFLPLAIYSSANPYPAPQRYNIFHTDRISYDQSGGVTSRTSGLWAGHTDVNSPATLLSAANLDYRRVQRDFTEDCERELYCNLPTITPRSTELVPFSAWIEFSPPTPFSPEPGLQLSGRTCEGGPCELDFTITGGTPHMAIVLWPRDGVTLERWSFSSPVTNVTTKNGRPVYYILHTHCTFEDPQPEFDFTVWLAVASGINGLTDPVLDVVFNAHKSHHEGEMTLEFANFTRSLPEWFNVVPYITTKINYIF